jgi:hypothetical protein
MPVLMQPARTAPGAVPSVVYGQYTAASTAIVQGSILIFNAGEYELAGADPSLIAGLALQAQDTAPGYQAANNPVPITGRQRKISVAVADRVAVFSATLTNGSSARISPAQADIGAQYGITAYSGVWTVDKAKLTTSARVSIVGINTETNEVYFKWLADHIYGAT